MKLKCFVCGKELDWIETREVALYWDAEAGEYKFTEPAEVQPYCPYCGAYLGDDPKIREILAGGDRYLLSENSKTCSLP